MASPTPKIPSPETEIDSPRWEFVAPIEFFESDCMPLVCLVTGATQDVQIYEIPFIANERVSFYPNFNIRIPGRDHHPRVALRLPFTPQGHADYQRETATAAYRGVLGCLSFFGLNYLIFMGLVRWVPQIDLSRTMLTLEYVGFCILSSLLALAVLVGVNYLLKRLRWILIDRSVQIDVYAKFLKVDNDKPISPARWRGMLIDSTPGAERSYEIYEELKITLIFCKPETAANLHTIWKNAFAQWQKKTQ